MKIVIHGSCVSRDGFGRSGTHGSLKVVDYFARSSLGSCAATAPSMKVPYEQLSSSFQSRMVERDVRKQFFRSLERPSFDILLLDLIDERFDLLQTAPGAIATMSSEFMATGAMKIAGMHKVIRSGSPEHWDNWVKGTDRFLAILSEHGILERLVVNRAMWAELTEGGSSLPTPFTKEAIGSANSYLARMYDYLASKLPENQIISFDDQVFIAQTDHEWGIAPYHYISEYYASLLTRLEQFAAAIHVPDKVMTKVSPLITDINTYGGFSDVGRHWKSGKLTGEIQIADAGKPGKELVVRAHIQGGPATKENQALVSFEFVGAPDFDPRTLGLVRSGNPDIGLYQYLETKPGTSVHELRLPVPKGTRSVKVGIRAWGGPDDLVLVNSSIWFDQQVQAGSGVALISVDVEAQPGRAASDHVAKLIYGRFGKESYGIQRLCDLFDDAGVQGTFFVDFAECALHGDKAIFEAAQLLQGRGHDVQLHLHSEVLIRAQSWAHDRSVRPSFESIDIDVARRVIDYGVRKFSQALGEPPKILRPGGMLFSPSFLHAAKECGLLATSALYLPSARETAPELESYGLFSWENGLLEVPVDVALDPLVDEQLRRAVVNAGSKARGVASYLLHSTSLLRRPLDGSSPFFEGYEPNYERTLVDVLKLITTTYRTVTHAELVETFASRGDMPTFPLSRGSSQSMGRGEVITCNVCQTALDDSTVASGRCGCCKSRTRQRVLKRVFDELTGNLFSGKRVIANFADETERDYLMTNVEQLVNFDVRPMPGLDLVADAQHLSSLEDRQFDVFVSIYALNHIRDDAAALREMKRVLRDGGTAVIMVPFRSGRTTLLEDTAATYGKEALDTYGVGSYRYYGLLDLLPLLSSLFDVTYLPAIDPVTGNKDAVFLCRKSVKLPAANGETELKRSRKSHAATTV
jgi:hypothetical protein